MTAAALWGADWGAADWGGADWAGEGWAGEGWGDDAWPGAGSCEILAGGKTWTDCDGGWFGAGGSCSGAWF